MNFLQAIETEYYAIRAMHSDNGALAGRLFATSVIAAQLFPAVVVLLVNNSPLPRGGTAVLGFIACFIVMWLLIDAKRDRFTPQHGEPFARIGDSSRFALTLYLFITIVGLAAIARVSPLLSLLGYIVIAALPLQKLVKSE